MSLMIYYQHAPTIILFQMSLHLTCPKRFDRHYLFRLYREEIRVLENGTFPKGDVKKLQRYKEEIEEDEELLRFKAFVTMAEDSRLFHEIPTKSYKRHKSGKRRKKGISSDEKWQKRVRFHLLQNFLLQKGYFLRQRNHHTTIATTTLLMLPYSSNKIIPNFMKKILPSFMFYKYYLPLHSIIKQVPTQIQSLAKACVDTLKGNVRAPWNKTRHNGNKTLHRYLRKIEWSLRKLEKDLKININTTRKPSKSKIKLKEQVRRLKRKKKFKKLLKEINKLYPPPTKTTMDPFFLGFNSPTYRTTALVTWTKKWKRLRTTRRKRNISRTTAVMSKRKMKKMVKEKKKEQRQAMADLK